MKTATDMQQRRAARRADYERTTAETARREAARERYPFNSCGQALRYAAHVHQRMSGCPAVWPEEDRVDGGVGSTRAERLAQAASALGALSRAGLSSAEVDVVIAHACGTTTVQGGPYGWAWAASRLGCREVAVYGRIGAVQRRAHDALRGAGLVAPLRRQEVDVYRDGDEYAHGWGDVADAFEALGVRVSIRTLQRWVKNAGCPVNTNGPIRARIADLREWLRAGGVEREVAR